MTVWFTADTHFGHANIINYCRRPFASVEEMNAALIQRWNYYVQPEDTVFHLGDFAFHSKPRDMQSLLTQLHGKKILIWGNHDHSMTRKLPQWEQVIQFLEVQLGDFHLTLCHYPLRTWAGQRRGGIHLHGHCHATLPDRIPGSLDVGVDGVADFRPLTLIEAASYALAPA
ncbi:MULTISPECIES: metallophosphoesterase [unclassified Beijerinckia]|uniref:metallophosphoesterase family protein n=1 Tax=unclassified Beijerinckia TaxID=2638183 RepID=UPI0008996BCF|nr:MULTISPECIES: metallophosphoesterase [unclassified Beijerinckia]MDH7796392.1 calcineurin-like phosphoesterase family protein [Beijerinckia sp. GAS462]SEC43206.1 Calcineurin-like phosphoesterase superfamily protein [Beijerinckia sp. 28-YEA-48]